MAGISYAFLGRTVAHNRRFCRLYTPPPKKTQETKAYIIRTEYLVRWRTTVALYKVPNCLIYENLAAYMLQFGYRLSFSHESMHGEWRFDMMIDNKIFFTPNWLDFAGCRLPIIVTRRKPACWHCGEIGHLSENCQRRRHLRNRPIISGIHSHLSRRKVKKRLP